MCQKIIFSCNGIEYWISGINFIYLNFNIKKYHYTGIDFSKKVAIVRHSIVALIG